MIRQLPHPILPLVASIPQPMNGGETPQTQCEQAKQFSSSQHRPLQDRSTLPYGDLNHISHVTQGGRHAVEMFTNRILFFIPPSRRHAHA
jgi:hypothetical protein